MTFQPESSGRQAAYRPPDPEVQKTISGDTALDPSSMGFQHLGDVRDPQFKWVLGQLFKSRPPKFLGRCVVHNAWVIVGSDNILRDMGGHHPSGDIYARNIPGTIAKECQIVSMEPGQISQHSEALDKIYSKISELKATLAQRADEIREGRDPSTSKHMQIREDHCLNCVYPHLNERMPDDMRDMPGPDDRKRNDTTENLCYVCGGNHSPDQPHQFPYRPRAKDPTNVPNSRSGMY
jgi:hypothetical protein